MPRVSIGLPVHDGERYLPQAFESLLAQTFEDFELIVSDNASSDRTREICERYAAADARIRYVRSEENLGAARNFDRVLELARGELFKWAAHDDRCDRRFLARCVEALDAQPEAVLAHPLTTIIDESGERVEEHDAPLPTDSPDPVTRFRSLARGGHKCFEVFGLIRREPLVAAGGMGNHLHGDGVLLARLALAGPFAIVPERLFEARRHARQSMALLGDRRSGARYVSWFDPARAGRPGYPYWRVLAEYLRAIREADVAPLQRFECRKALLRWMWIFRRRLRGDLTAALRQRLARRSAGVDGPRAEERTADRGDAPLRRAS